MQAVIKVNLTLHLCLSSPLLLLGFWWIAKHEGYWHQWGGLERGLMNGWMKNEERWDRKMRVKEWRWNLREGLMKCSYKCSSHGRRYLFFNHMSSAPILLRCLAVCLQRMCPKWHTKPFQSSSKSNGNLKWQMERPTVSLSSHVTFIYIPLWSKYRLF